MALVLAWHHRRALGAFLRKPLLRSPCLLDVNPQTWIEHGVRVVVLDFDGVLSPHAGRLPLPEVLPWLTGLLATFGNNTFILSNLPTSERIAFFHKHFPNIQFLQPQRPKPYADGIELVLAQTHVQPKEILVVDDRLLTGILLAVNEGCQGLYITSPYRDFRAHWAKELFFHVLRKGERALLSLMLLY